MRARRWRHPWAAWAERFVLSSGPEVIALLERQGAVSVAALEAFQRWSAGEAALAAEVRRLEHEADDARRDLLGALQRALATPISQEDLYILSERTDRIVNQAKNLVGEAEALRWTPDAHAASMAEHLANGIKQLQEGFLALGKRAGNPASAADSAVAEVRAVEHAYRAAMASLREMEDLRAVFLCREMYRGYVRTAEAVASVADRLWYAVLAEG